MIPYVLISLHFALISLQFAGASAATSPVVISVDPEVGGWNVTVVFGTDTLFNEENLLVPTTVQLPSDRSYFIRASTPDILYSNSVFVYVPNNVNDTVRVHFTKNSVACNRQGAMELSNLLHSTTQALYRALLPGITIQEPAAVLQRMEAIVVKYVGESRSIKMDSATQLYYRRVVEPSLFAMMGACDCRVAAYLASRRPSCMPLHFKPNSNVALETHHIGQTFTSVIIGSLVKWNEKATYESTRKIADLMGKECECAVGFETLTDLSTYLDVHGAPHSCEDSLMMLVRSLVATGSSEPCVSGRREWDATCVALRKRRVDSITCRDMTKQVVTLHLHPDSIYVIHVWAMWAKKSMDAFDLSRLVSDTLKSLGVHMIHLHQADLKHFDRWLRVVFEPDQYFLENNEGWYIYPMRVWSYPTYIIVGKNNTIIERCYDEMLLRGRVEAALRE